MSESHENKEYRLWAERHPKAAQELNQLQNDAALRQRLKIIYNIPDSLLDAAVKIWWEGKED